MYYCNGCPNNHKGKCSYDNEPIPQKGYCHLDEEYAFEIALAKEHISDEEWAIEQAIYNEVEYD